jgi:hypothetical protein
MPCTEHGRWVALRALPLAVLIGALLVLAGSCGDDSTSPLSAQDVPEPKVPVDRNLWRTAWEISNEAQREALRDGEVTFDEYEAAALKTAQCITDAGMQGEAVLNTSTHTYEVAARYQSLGSYQADAERRAASAACGEEHWLGINQAWAAQHQPSEQTLEDARRALGACLREAGLDVPDGASAAEMALFRNAPAWGPCVQKVGAEYKLPNYGGG